MTERYLPAQLRVGSGHALICQRFSGRILPGNWLAHQSRISERMREFSGRIFRILSEILRGDSLATPRLQANALADWSVIRARPRWSTSAEPETLHTAQNHLSACLAASRGLAVVDQRGLARITLQIRCHFGPICVRRAVPGTTASEFSSAQANSPGEFRGKTQNNKRTFD